MLNNKTIIITGASSGLGKVLAEKLASQQNQLVLFGRDQEKLQQTVNNCQALGATVISVIGNVGNQQDCQRLVDTTIQTFNRLDILINNAGISMWQPFSTSELKLHEQLMQTNYFGSIYCTHYALPYLQQSQGHLVVISSLQGLLAVPYHTGYTAAKHAVQGFFAALRLELDDTVKLLIVSPSWITGTELRRNALGNGNKNTQAEHGIDVNICADKIIHAIIANKQELIVPAKYRLVIILEKLLPKTVHRFIKRKVQQETQAK